MGVLATARCLRLRTWSQRLTGPVPLRRDAASRKAAECMQSRVLIVAEMVFPKGELLVERAGADAISFESGTFLGTPVICSGCV